MKAVIQRIASRASVTVGTEVVSSIGRGLCVLVGIGIDDTTKDAEALAKKILGLRVFDDESSQQMWKRSVKDVEGEILCVSQFTLHAVTTKGSKPDFHKSMKGPEAKALYGHVLDELGKGLPGGRDKVKDGVFGAMMQVDISNDVVSKLKTTDI